MSLLDSLIASARGDDLKFVFVGGKGGVGKTTSSSAIAMLLAIHAQRRVLLVSTDPAHSLSDAWRCSFSNTPTQVIPSSSSSSSSLSASDENRHYDNNNKVQQDVGRLDVMEVNPQETLQSELEQWATMSKQLMQGNNQFNNSLSSSMDGWHSKLTQFQEWLSGIPGIDEATALSTAIQHIESGKYDVIVFDTAPTGHTIKLLALPHILEQGIDKLQAWQTTFWTYWESFKAGFGHGKNVAALKAHVTNKLIKYKQDIQKVARMIQDQQRTRFVVVCIAEHLSVAETKRLLQELAKNRVVTSHIIVNQLVVNDALTETQLTSLQEVALADDSRLPKELLQRALHSCRLTTARKMIQQRYLSELESCSETQTLLEGICKVPLLADEVNGKDAIHRFARLLVTDDILPLPTATDGTENQQCVGESRLDDSKFPTDASEGNSTLSPGDIVQLNGLTDFAQFNGSEATITNMIHEHTGRYKAVVYKQGEKKSLDILPENAVYLRKGEKRPKTHRDTDANDSTSRTTPQGMTKVAEALLKDPEISQMIEANPRYKVAVEECLNSPLNAIKYVGDPDMSPLISKIMAKMGSGGGGGV
jgi:arsenite/tail-anchored protein-transporting ATPase